MPSKNTEREILFSVFKQDVIEQSLIEDETPDFILTDAAKNEKIGVEITTIYTNMASAISQNEKFLDNYIDSNKVGGKPKKKPSYLKDLKVAPVEGGDEFVHKGHVVWHIKKLEDYFSFFQKIIEQKSESYKIPIKGLEFVNLIAKDEEDYFKPFKVEVGVLYGLIRQHKLFEAILNSNFQEIYFISQFEKGNYCIPLRWLIFKSEYAIFEKFWQHINIKNAVQLHNVKLKLEIFFVCMIHLGFHNIYLDSRPEYRLVIFGNKFWKISKSANDITEHPLFTAKLPDENRAKNMLKNHENYQQLFNEYMAFRQDLIPQLGEHLFIKTDDKN